MATTIHEGNLTLLLETVATSGHVLPTEQRAALQLSLALKKQEAGLRTLQLWGRVFADNGRDYLVAQGCRKPPCQFEKRYEFDIKNYYSQDGIKWLDLQPVSLENYERCNALVGGFTGDPAHMYEVEEESDQPEATPPVAQDGTEDDGAEEAEEQAAPEATPPKIYQVGELERLAAVIKSVDRDTAVAPIGSVVLDPNYSLVHNKLFAGLSYPDKLESYVHILKGPTEAPLSRDIKGLWSIQYDSFLGACTLRSLVWPGYAFYYSTVTNTYGGLYFGNGDKNQEVAFMI